MPNIKTAKKALIGELVGLDGQAKHAQHTVLNVWREVINFEGQKDNNYAIQLDGEETYFVHSTAIEDLLNGEDIGAYIKSSYKGGTIQLIKK